MRGWSRYFGFCETPSLEIDRFNSLGSAPPSGLLRSPVSQHYRDLR